MHDYASMEKTAKQLRCLVDDFSEQFNEVARGTQWDGPSKNAFVTLLTEEVLKFRVNMIKIADIPIIAAKNMQQQQEDENTQKL